MNVARIVVLTIALSAGGVAAYLASGIDSQGPRVKAPFQPGSQSAVSPKPQITTEAPSAIDRKSVV